MKTDNEKIKELIALSEANPDLNIITMVDFDVCVSDDYDYWLGCIGKIEKDFVYFAEQAEGELVLIGEDKIYDYISEGELSLTTKARIDELIANGGIKEEIIVYIELPELTE